MSKYKQWGVYGVVVIGALWLYGLHMKRVGELNGQIAHLTRETHRVDTVYVAQTKTLVKVRRVTDSILTTDTLFRVDTVRQLIRAERIACDAVVQTCEQRVALRDSTIRALKSQSHTWSKVLWFLAGAGAGAVISR